MENVAVHNIKRRNKSTFTAISKKWLTLEWIDSQIAFCNAKSKTFVQIKSVRLPRFRSYTGAFVLCN